MVRIALLTPDLCKEIKSICRLEKIDCYQVIFDVDLIQKLGFTSWIDIPYQGHHIWTEINRRNSMELTSSGKKLIKSTTNEIVNPSLLFPPYPIKEEAFYNSLAPNSLVFGEVVTGQLHKSTFTTDKFIADQLCFKIIKPFKNFQHLNISEISYGGIKLESRANQFITRSFFAFIK